MQPTSMTLKVLLPFQVFAEESGVTRIVAETGEGSFGLLPRRLDCVAALAPGILIYENEAESEVYVAVDEGVLIKTGPDVLVSVRNAIAGKDLGRLRERWSENFSTLTNGIRGCARCWRKWKAVSSADSRNFIMTDEPENKTLKPKPELSQEIGAKAARKLRARRHVTRTDESDDQQGQRPGAASRIAPIQPETNCSLTILRFHQILRGSRIISFFSPVPF